MIPLGWKAAHEIASRFSGHHKLPTLLRMKTHDGKTAQIDKENADVFKPPFSKIFDGEAPEVDIQVILKMIEKRTTMTEIDKDIMMDKLEDHIQRMKNCKAPGESKIPAEPFKWLTKAGKILLLGILNRFMDGKCDPEEWQHFATLKCLFKKGDRTQQTGEASAART
jgi:hypothetical protein